LPEGLQIAWLVRELAVAKDAIAWEVRAEIAAGGHETGVGRAGFRHVQQRAWLWIALTEEEEVIGQVARHDDEVGLHVAHGQAGRGLAPATGADRPTNLSTGGVLQMHVVS